MSVVDLKAKLAALQDKAATVVAAAQRAMAEKRVERAAEKRLEKQIQSQLKRLDASDREALLAEFGGDEAAAEKAAAEMLKNIDSSRQRYLKFAGWNISVGLRLKRLLELEALRGDAEKAQESYGVLPAGSEKTEMMAEINEMISAVEAEKAGLEADPNLKFFSWEAGLASLENVGEKQILAEIDKGLAGGYLRELPTEEAEEIRSSAKQAKTEGRDERHTPFIRVLRRPAPKPDDRESLENFRCVTYVADPADRERESRNRLVFYALNSAWSAFLTIRKEGREAFKSFRANCLPLAEAAEGKTGIYLGQVTQEDPWIPMRRDPETKKFVQMTHRESGEVIKNHGVLIAVVEAKGGGFPTIHFPVLNREVKVEGLEPTYVGSGLFMPLRTYGAWGDGWRDDPANLEPVKFRFETEAGKAFAGLRPASQGVWLEAWQLWNLRAVLCRAAGIQPPPKEEKPAAAVATAAGPSQPHTERGKRADGSRAGEARRGKGGRPGGNKPPEAPARVQTLADVEED